MKRLSQFMTEAKNSDWKSEPPETPSKIEKIWMYSDFEEWDDVWESLVQDIDMTDDDWEPESDIMFDTIKYHMRDWASKRPELSYKSKHHKSLKIDVLYSPDANWIHPDNDPIYIFVTLNGKKSDFMWVDHDGIDSRKYNKRDYKIIAELMERKVWEKEPSMLKWVKGLK